MSKMYRSAMGKGIDIDSILLRNEEVIAVGNYKVNARGDELGPGGKVIKTRDQIMKEYYALNTPVAADPVHVPAPPVVAQPTVSMSLVEDIITSENSGMDEEDNLPEVTVPIEPEVVEVPVVTKPTKKTVAKK